MHGAGVGRCCPEVNIGVQVVDKVDTATAGIVPSDMGKGCSGESENAGEERLGEEHSGEGCDCSRVDLKTDSTLEKMSVCR